MEQEEKLAAARREVRWLQVQFLNSSLPADKLEILRDLARMARAKIRLRLKALGKTQS